MNYKWRFCEKFDKNKRNYQTLLVDIRKGKGYDKNEVFFQIYKPLAVKVLCDTLHKWVKESTMKTKILIVDDMEYNREILTEILQDEYEVMQAENGKQALEIIKERHSELVLLLLDLLMPEMDGVEVLNTLRSPEWKGLVEHIPVLIISSEMSVNVERQCFDLGISDFIRKPFDNVLVKRRVNNIVELFLYKHALEEKVALQMKELQNQYEVLKMQAGKLQESNDKIIDVLGTVVEYRNLESGQHIRRVRDFSRVLARQMMMNYPEYGLTPAAVETIAAASALHDIGKIAIPDHILLKPGRLTEEEYECMKTHSINGCEILDNIRDIWEDDYGDISYEICRYHHERYDGNGYPDGLKGDEIPVSAQIVSLADVYDALISKRIYKEAFSKDVAYQMIMNGNCGVFSPKLLHCFQEV